jgi:plastocyanin
MSTIYLSLFLCAGMGMGAASAATVHVAITDYTFTPMTSIVHPGDTVVWTNGDSVPHTATALDGKSFDTGTIDPGASASLKLSKPGEYRYHCAIHPDMLGTVDVK